jgi:hypothetical protein
VVACPCVWSCYTKKTRELFRPVDGGRTVLQSRIKNLFQPEATSDNGRIKTSLRRHRGNNNSNSSNNSFANQDLIMGVMEKIREIEAEMARTQKNKATNYHLGTLKAKLARLRNELFVEQSGGSSGGATGEGFDVARNGDARVALIGFPSAGKSTLLGALTATVRMIQSTIIRVFYSTSRLECHGNRFCVFVFFSHEKIVYFLLTQSYRNPRRQPTSLPLLLVSPECCGTRALKFKY